MPGGQEEEVRLVPYFDGVGPRTSAKGSLGAQSAAAAHQGDGLGYILSNKMKMFGKIYLWNRK